MNCYSIFFNEVTAGKLCPNSGGFEREAVNIQGIVVGIATKPPGGVSSTASKTDDLLSDF
jgi:hypothetical protein